MNTEADTCWNMLSHSCSLQVGTLTHTRWPTNAP